MMRRRPWRWKWKKDSKRRKWKAESISASRYSKMSR